MNARALISNYVEISARAFCVWEDRAMTGRTERLRCELGPELVSLVTGSASGDERAWNRLLDAVCRMSMDLARGSYRMGIEDAEDLAQTVQIRVAERLPQLRQPEAFPLWVRRVIHHVALDMLRQRHAQVSLDDENACGGEPAASSEGADPYDLALLRTDLDRALDHLPPLYREPIQLHLLQGMPQDQVGERLGRPRSTVATQIERGLQRLRRSLPGLASVAH
jgi:RNA polymerase sigma factor (sigma-70 family)